MRHTLLFLISLLFGLSSKSQVFCDDFLQVPYYHIDSTNIATGDTIDLPNTYSTTTVNAYSGSGPLSFWSNSQPFNWGISCDCMIKVVPNTPVTELSIYHLDPTNAFSHIPPIIIDGDSTSNNGYNSYNDFPMTISGVSISIDTNVIFDSVPSINMYKLVLQGNISEIEILANRDLPIYKICYDGDHLNNIEIDDIPQATIYPNPTTDVVNIDISYTSSYNLYSSQGKSVLLSGHLKKGKNNIDLSTLSTGIYFLEITNHEGLSSTQKIIKQ